MPGLTPWARTYIKHADPAKTKQFKLPMITEGEIWEPA